MSQDDFLSRWSRRKHQARKGEVPAEPAASPAAAPPIEAPSSESPAPAGESLPLPPVESLTTESDFTPFMKPEVDQGLRNQALKTLFSDPQFNVMDGLDVYIDDYSKPDPLPEGWLEKMTQVARLGVFEPPKDPAPDAAAEEGQLADAADADRVAAPKDPPEGEDNHENT